MDAYTQMILERVACHRIALPVATTWLVTDSLQLCCRMAYYVVSGSATFFCRGLVRGVDDGEGKNRGILMTGGDGGN